MQGYAARIARATLVVALGLAAAAGAAQAAPSGLNAYSVKAQSGEALRLLAQKGFDLTRARATGASDRRDRRPGAWLYKVGLDPRSSAAAPPARRASTPTAATPSAGRTSTTRTSARSAGVPGGIAARDAPRGVHAPGRREHGHRQARDDRPLDQRQADHRAADHARRARAHEPRRRRAPPRCTCPRSTPASGSRPSRRAGSRTSSSTTTARAGRRRTPQGHDIAGLSAAEITSLVNTRELWIVPIANPDGYDYTFTPGNRAVAQEPARQQQRRPDHGRRRRRPEPQLPRPLGLRQRGLLGRSVDARPSAAPARRPSPRRRPPSGSSSASGFEFLVNYHSAAELLLYGTGFQVQTDTEDDPIYRALAGTDADPAIAGNPPGAPDPYDPDVSSELYTTNGDTDAPAPALHGTLAFTPEMDIADPARGGGGSVFDFQDSEADLEQAFEKNIPFALDVAKSAADPANPVSHLGREAPAFEIHPFTVSFGDPQTVRVNAKRALGRVSLHWTVNGGDGARRADHAVRRRRALRRRARRLLPRDARQRHRHEPRRRGQGLVRGRRRALAVLRLRDALGLRATRC